MTKAALFFEITVNIKTKNMESFVIFEFSNFFLSMKKTIGVDMDTKYPNALTEAKVELVSAPLHEEPISNSETPSASKYGFEPITNEMQPYTPQTIIDTINVLHIRRTSS